MLFNMAIKKIENKKEDCIFCKIIAGKDSQKPLYEDDNFIVLPDKFPVADGHCLIIPRRHYSTVLDLPSSLGTELLSIAKAQGLRLIVLYKKWLLQV